MAPEGSVTIPVISWAPARSVVQMTNIKIFKAYLKNFMNSLLVLASKVLRDLISDEQKYTVTGTHTLAFSLKLKCDWVRAENR
jgi:hypothetical protein